MQTPAGEGALETAALVVNIFIAIGTIGAAAVAGALGLRARSDSAARQREAQERAARQMITVFAWWMEIEGTPGGPGVQVVNASAEAVTQLDVTIRLPNLDDTRGTTWRWKPRTGGALPFLLAGQSQRLGGALWKPDATAPHGGSVFVLTKPEWHPQVTLRWIDTEGTIWERVDHHAPKIVG